MITQLSKEINTLWWEEDGDSLVGRRWSLLVPQLAITVFNDFTVRIVLMIN